MNRRRQYQDPTADIALRGATEHSLGEQLVALLQSLNLGPEQQTILLGYIICGLSRRQLAQLVGRGGYREGVAMIRLRLVNQLGDRTLLQEVREALATDAEGHAAETAEIRDLLTRLARTTSVGLRCPVRPLPKA